MYKFVPLMKFVITSHHQKLHMFVNGHHKLQVSSWTQMLLIVIPNQCQTGTENCAGTVVNQENRSQLLAYKETQTNLVSSCTLIPHILKMQKHKLQS